MSTSISMHIEKVQQLSDEDRVEHVLYHVCNAGFELMGDMFLMQLKSIHSRYQKNFITVCQLLKNPLFYLLHLMLYKDRQFVIYMEKYGRVKVMEEIYQLILSPHLRKKTSDISLESFESFSYVEIDSEYQRQVTFTWSLVCICVNSS